MAARKDPRATWNRLSADYQANRSIATDSAHYGPWAPPESELRLLGNVHGKRILELGCGGGQCTVAFARQGASAAGLDVSDAQLAFAQKLAATTGVAVRFVQGSAEDLSAFAAGAWDIVFSVYTLQYLTDVKRCLRECERMLVAGGKLVFCLDHPLRDCFIDVDDDTLAIFPVRSYFDNDLIRWRWGGHATPLMETAHYTIGQWCDLLNGSGLRVARIVEPEPPHALLDAVWPEYDALAALRHIPQTIIFVAEKP